MESSLGENILTHRHVSLCVCSKIKRVKLDDDGVYDMLKWQSVVILSF